MLLVYEACLRHVGEVALLGDRTLPYGNNLEKESRLNCTDPQDPLEHLVIYSSINVQLHSAFDLGAR